MFALPKKLKKLLEPVAEVDLTGQEEPAVAPGGATGHWAWDSLMLAPSLNGLSMEVMSSA